MFKNNVWPHVYDVRTEHDQLWFRLNWAPNFRFCAAYIAPSDSPYYSPQDLATLHEYAISQNDNVVIMGDLNSRIPHLDQLSDAVNNVRYSKNVDTVSNTNGKRLTEICVTSGLKPVNHLIYRDKVFDGNFTFKQKQNWISQIDWVVMSCRALPHLQEFKVLNALSLPTNHAPLSVELGSFTIPLFDIQCRAKQFGEAEPRKFHSRKRPLTMSNIDPAAFVEQLPDPESCWQLINDVDSLSGAMSDLHYETATKSKPCEQHMPTTKMTSAGMRWNFLKEQRDPRQL